MIHSLYIRNYLLIEHLELEFSGGFITLTGETGAGKSILMGALSLILGQRADTSVLKLKESKCIVEGAFSSMEGLERLFRENELDLDEQITLRREIAPNGKSRAFINDTPVHLPLLREVGSQLVDIHSQHHNLRLNDQLYQMEVINYMAGLGAELGSYQQDYGRFSQLKLDIGNLTKESLALREELDYLQFQFQELDSAGLKAGEMEELEADLQRAEHADEIRTALLESASLMFSEQSGVLDQLSSALSRLRKIASIYRPSGQLSERMESVYIELKDIGSELEELAGRAETEPGGLEELRARMDRLMSLLQKHRVSKAEDLIRLRDELGEKIESVSFSDEKLDLLEKERQALRSGLEKQAGKLRAKREKAAAIMEKEVVAQLKELGIPQARFTVRLNELSDFDAFGKDQVSFLFSANKQLPMEEISRVASGGEVSRLMLCIKALMTGRQGMPTLIFDEIDTGVSGEIADKVGGLMARLSEGRQVLAITHLPQVASRGEQHFVVFKEEAAEASYTRIRKLNTEERVVEIAGMLSGEEVTEAALSNARVLLRI